MEKIDEYIVIGLPLEVDIPKWDRKKKSDISDIYFSQLMDFDDISLSISLPQRQGSLMPSLGKGTTVTVRFSLKDAIYIGTAEIIRWEKSPQSLIVTRPYRVTRIQRRNFVRVEANLPVNFIIQQQDDKAFIIKAETTDISGGGLLVYLSQFLPLFAELDIELEISTGSAKPVVLKIPSQVCRSNKLRDDFYQIGISFLDVQENDRDKIIKYIFKRMRELRQTRVNA